MSDLSLVITPTKAKNNLRRDATREIIRTERGQFHAYPNPTTDVLTVNFINPVYEAHSTTRMALSDVLGKTVQEIILHGSHGSATLNVGTLPAGVYVVTWTDNLGNRHQRKVTVTHL